MDTSNIEIKKSDFLSEGVRCDGDLLLPKNVTEKPPVIIMAVGLAGQKNFGLKPYSEKFVNEGFAVFIFDYRTFGKSDGLPRQVVDPFDHCKDWHQAITHVKTLKQDIDHEKIFLWGSSFSGGHVIAVASERKNDKSIIGIMAQVPFVGGKHSAKQKSIKDMALAGIYGLYDTLFYSFGNSASYSPVVAKAGSFAALNTDECYDGYIRMVGDDPIWKNQMASRSFLKMLIYNPMKNAHQIQIPVLILAGKNDSLIPIEAIKMTSSKIPFCDFKIMGCNHFQPYYGTHFEDFSNHQINFAKGLLNK
ncbi:unnamed protein product [Cunninghamella blakesleeana]